MKWYDSCKELSDNQLMILVNNGQKSALRELYKRYHQKLLNYFFRMLGGDEQKSQDFLQDIFIKIIDKSDYYNPDLNFKTWVFSIASNMCKNEYRSQKVRSIIKNDPHIDQHLHSYNQENLYDQRELHKAIETELSLIDSVRRDTFILRFQENLPIKDIAQIMGCSAGTIKSRLFYISRHLAKKLESFNPIRDKEDKQ